MLSKLQAVLDTDAEKICGAIAKKYSPEGIYSFALYTSGEYSYVIDSFSTADGLKKVAQKYLQEKSYQEEWGSLDVAMRELRWSPCDSPYHGQFERDFKKANELLDAYWESVATDSDRDFLEACRQVHDVFTRVLTNVRDSGVFHDAVILNVLMGDQSNEERFLNAEPLNSKASLAKFQKELEFDASELSRLRKNRWKA